MVTVHLSEAEARRLGIDAKPAKARTSRTAAKGELRAVCHECREELVGETAARRHADTTHHLRQDIPL